MVNHGGNHEMGTFSGYGVCTIPVKFTPIVHLISLLATANKKLASPGKMGREEEETKI